jgi:CheY-like chemotaxis protein
LRKSDKSQVILIAEDDPDDQLLARDALRQINRDQNLHFVEDGLELMDYLKNHGKYTDPNNAPRPRLILLDLNLPGKDGRQALKEIKNDPELRRIPVIIYTTSKAREDILRSYDSGSNAYIIKPETFTEIIEVMRVIDQHWFRAAELPPM